MYAIVESMLALITYEYMGVLRFSPSLNHMTICILSPARAGTMSHGNFATPPWTASTIYVALAGTERYRLNAS